MVQEMRLRIPEVFGTVALDEFVVMPDHIHGIVFLTRTPTNETGPSIGDISTWFKSTTVERYRNEVRSGRWQPYVGKLWQKNFHDRVLREGELDIRRSYIQQNPDRWRRQATADDGF